MSLRVLYLSRTERVPETLEGFLEGEPGSQLERCWDVERRLKSGGEPRAELTALVAELCAPG